MKFEYQAKKKKNWSVCFAEQQGADEFRPRFELAALVTQNFAAQRRKVENQSNEQTAAAAETSEEKSFSRCVVLPDFPDKENQINRPELQTDLRLWMSKKDPAETSERETDGIVTGQVF